VLASCGASIPNANGFFGTRRHALIAFCEAHADFRIASDLVDRVLRDAGPAWVGDVMDAAVDGLRTYCGDDEGREFFDLHRLGKYVDKLSTRVPHGHFDGEPGAADALMARTVFWIVRSFVKARGHVDAVILVRDMDDQPVAREAGLRQARVEAQAWASFRIVLGCPNVMREAWVLVGFDPDGPDEEARIADLRRELGFWPNVDAHRLTAKNEQAMRSAKRVLRVLSLDERSREERCWAETPLDRLRSRGEPTGLYAFLLEVEQSLAPLCAQP
jgi:hypothetical protein